ncbi:MAG: DUF1330 domain-containing protein [Amylibacter sp.]|jgi:uncharacterized protein (DUF1330 family)|tara:strand:+ start:364 stop:654 length:291 start_codon:yes stop_codon:yes gene_type:complete
MPKGYLVANIRVKDKEKFAAFSGMAAPVIKAHGGKVLARGPGAERHEGSVEGIVMMIEFESIDTARTFYLSDEYQAAKAVRDACSETDLMIIEGTE